MREVIIQTLMEIENDYNVKILYACESGSRAWGFPSKDSDYDVRFIYVHQREHYLSIDPVGVGGNRDVIEKPINDVLDVSGWDLTKALKLYRKSNPPLLEWLHSDIVYYQAYTAIERMKKLQTDIFAPDACLYHYLNMANNNFKTHLLKEEVKIKKYFYVLRPILAAQWIERNNEFPPLTFQVLLREMLPPGKLKQEVEILLERKLAGEEFDLEPRIGVIHKFAEEELPRLQNAAKLLEKSRPDNTGILNKLFRETLSEVWG